MTNFEYIKSMSIEELAQFIEENGSDKFHEIADGFQCRMCERRYKLACEADQCPYLDTYGVKQWLQATRTPQNDEVRE